MTGHRTIKIRKGRDGRIVVSAPLALWQSLGLLEGRESDRLIRVFDASADVPPELVKLIEALRIEDGKQ